MKKKRMELIPKPRSSFVKVKCPDCGNEQVTFSNTDETVHCNVCGAVLAEPSGGKSSFRASVVEELG